MTTVTNHSRYLSSSLDATKRGAPVLKTRLLGNTDLRVGEIGVGTAALGAGGLSTVPDGELNYTLGVALDMQAGLIDAACTPGDNRVLRQLGFVLRDRRKQAQICLRVAGGPQDISALTETALRLLDTGHVDILLWDHPAFAKLKAQDAGWAALRALKQAGKARFVGVSLDKPEELRAAIEQAPVELLQFPLNAFDQANVSVLDAAAAKGLGLIAVKPLDSGWLTGRFSAGHFFLDERRRWSRGDKARRARFQRDFEALAAKPGTTMAQAALQFVLSFPQVGCAVAGVSEWRQVVGNVDASAGELDAATVASLRKLWAESIEERPLAL